MDKFLETLNIPTQNNAKFKSLYTEFMTGKETGLVIQNLALEA